MHDQLQPRAHEETATASARDDDRQQTAMYLIVLRYELHARPGPKLRPCLVTFLEVLEKTLTVN